MKARWILLSATMVGTTACANTVEDKGSGDGLVPAAVATSRLNTKGFRQNNMIGTFEPSNAIWRLKVQPPGTSEDAASTIAFMYGNPGDVPLVGDWDGDGVQTQGVWRNSMWYLANTLGGGASFGFQYGNADHVPIVGDWDGNGTATPGVFENGVFYLRNSNTTGDEEIVVQFGQAGDIPFAGDWDGDGIDTVGVYRKSQYAFCFTNNNQTGAPYEAYFFGGDASDQPIVGDWNGSGFLSPGVKRGSGWHLKNGFGSNPTFFDNFGSATSIPIVGNWRPKIKRYRQNTMIGAFNPTTTVWRLKVQQAGTVEDKNQTVVFQYGSPGDVPLIGDWDGDGRQTQGVWHNNGTWHLANALGGGEQIAFMYGNPDHIPIVGDWDGNGTATPGVFKDGVFILRNSNTQGYGEVVVQLGTTGDIPLAGDWDGDGLDSVGVYSKSQYKFFLVNKNEAGATVLSYDYGGDPTDQPILGDWSGTGVLSPGVKRGTGWHLKNSFGSATAFYDIFGAVGDIPLAGNWAPAAVNNQMYSPTRENWTTAAFTGTYGTYFVDVTGDGKDDAVASTPSGVSVRRSYGTYLGEPEPWTTAVYNGSYGTFYGDITGDKKADVIKNSGTGIEYRASNGSGFDPAKSVSSTSFGNAANTFLADIDGVNGSDLIYATTSSVKVRRFSPCSTGTCLGAEETLLTSGFNYTYRAFADVTGDGRADAVGIHSSGAVYVRRGTGSGFGALETWSNEALKIDPSVTVKRVIVRDFTGDGAADVVIVNSNEAYMRRSNRFQFGPNEKLSIQSTGSNLVAAAELTGDGRPELVEVSSSVPIKVTRSSGHVIGLRFIQFTADGNPYETDASLDQEIVWANKAYSALDIRFIRAGNHVVTEPEFATMTDDGLNTKPASILERVRNQFNPGCYVADLGDTGPNLIYPSSSTNWQIAAFATRCALPNEIIVTIANRGGSNGFVPSDASAVELAAGFYRDWCLAHEIGHFFGLGDASTTTAASDWDMVYSSSGAGQVKGFKSPAEVVADTYGIHPLSQSDGLSLWCNPSISGCPASPAGWTLRLPLLDSTSAYVNAYTGDEIMKGISWRMPDGTALYNVMGYAYNYGGAVVGQVVPAFSQAQIQVIRAFLTTDIRTSIRAPDGSFMWGGRPALGNLR